MASYFLSFARADDSKYPEFTFSGFGQLVVGQLDEKHAEYLDYDSSISLEQQSLAGLQGAVYFNPDFSINAQIIGYANEKKSSGIEWLYLNYQPTDNFQIKLGKNKTPFFNYSDVENVGFSYHWTTPPQQTYSSYMFESFDGIFVRYDIPNDYLALSAEAYWGRFDDDYYIGDDQVDVSVDDLAGLIVNGNLNNFNFRFSMHRGDGHVAEQRLDDFTMALRLANFNEMANQLAVDGEFKFYQWSLGYEGLDYFVKAEFTKTMPEVFLVPEIRSNYISAGYLFNQFTLHLTYAASDVEYDDPDNQIPLGIAPQLDALHYGYEQLLDNFSRDNLTSINVGARWDWRTNIAFKFDVTFLNAKDNQNGFFTDIDRSQFDYSSVLTQIAVTWVF